MYNFSSGSLPQIFNEYFKSIRNVHQYNTRLAYKKWYYLDKIRKNYGKVNIRYLGAKIWNTIKDDLKSENRTCFKHLIKNTILNDF